MNVIHIPDFEKSMTWIIVNDYSTMSRRILQNAYGYNMDRDVSIIEQLLCSYLPNFIVIYIDSTLTRDKDIFDVTKIIWLHAVDYIELTDKLSAYEGYYLLNTIVFDKAGVHVSFVEMQYVKLVGECQVAYRKFIIDNYLNKELC